MLAQGNAIEGTGVLVGPLWIARAFNPEKGLTWPTMQCNLDKKIQILGKYICQILGKYIFKIGQIHFSNSYSLSSLLLVIIIAVIDCKPTASSVFFWKSASEDNPQLVLLPFQMFNTLCCISLYNKESAKIILDCLRIKSIAQSSCYYCLLQLPLLHLLILQILLILLLLLLTMLQLLFFSPQLCTDTDY